MAEKTKLETELLALWSRHPGSKFTLDTIVYCLDRKKADIRRALFSLEQTGSICRQNKGAVALYSLLVPER